MSSTRGRRSARVSRPRREIGYVLVFENRGAAMGASNPHPHGQIWATATLPNEPAREQAAMSQWRAVHGALPVVRLPGARGARAASG